MIQIDDKIVSIDLLREKFCCDIAHCKGICCVDGNAGAPLEIGEADILEQEYEAYKPYLTAEGMEAIREQGFVVVDSEGDYTTPLIDQGECAFAYQEKGITLCAIERAHREGLTYFKKPISCHLYPIRLATFKNGSIGLNYHRWGVCSGAVSLGNKEGIPVYRTLQEAITRRFGAEFFDTLCQAEKLLQEEENNK